MDKIHEALDNIGADELSTSIHREQYEAYAQECLRMYRRVAGLLCLPPHVTRDVGEVTVQTNTHQVAPVTELLAPPRERRQRRHNSYKIL
jgi:hypothetical protein